MTRAPRLADEADVGSPKPGHLRISVVGRGRRNAPVCSRFSSVSAARDGAMEGDQAVADVQVPPDVRRPLYLGSRVVRAGPPTQIVEEPDSGWPLR
jgi:hypothetical protein